METASRESRVRAYFERAIASDATSRERVLAEARAEHESIATELESLLAYSEETGLLDAGVGGVAGVMAELGGESAPPKAIGQYEVVREIGRGGMGVVYEAQQRFPQRRVAIKLVRSDVATPSMMRRFRHEAQALGMLQHPAIAQVLEAGAADVDGRLRSFLAMEMAEGIALHKWVRERGASPGEVLALMAKIADGVDHAHKRGVIHRDLKPGNILVSERGDPKILDFGVARLVATDASPGATLATGAGQVIGTLGYMSPEQLSGDQRLVDVRSDVYALGAMLYELLAGKPAIELPTMSLLEAIEAVKSKEAQPLGRARRELRGDIEAIVGKALEKTVEKRYQSAADLAEDIRRHLSGQPVQARPQTALYQLRKFAARNKALVVAAGAIGATLIIATAAVGWQAVRATRAAERATTQARRAEQTTEVLKRMIAAGTPQVAGGRELTVREMLDASAQDIDGNADLDPLVRASTHVMLSDLYGSLTNFESSIEHARRAVETYSQMTGPTSRESLGARLELAEAMSRAGQDRADENYARAVYEDSLATLGPDDIVTLKAQLAWGMAMGERHILRVSEATDICEQSWRAHIRVLGEQAPATLVALNGVVITSGKLPRDPRAIEFARELVRVREAVNGKRSAVTLAAKANLATVLKQRDQNEEAWAIFREVEGPMLEVFGPDHIYTGFVWDGVAEALLMERRYAEALPRLKRGLDLIERRYGTHSFEHEVRLNAYAHALLWAGECEEALAVAQDIVDRSWRRNASSHVRDINLTLLAQVRAGRMEIDDAFAAVADIEDPVSKQDAIKLVTKIIRGSTNRDDADEMLVTSPRYRKVK